MAKRSLADIASALASKTSEQSDASWKKFFPFWKADVGTVTTVRFLPDADEDNPTGFLVENLVHELIVNGKREKVACLKMYGEDCPICALSAKYYDENDPEHNPALGKKYYRKRSYIGQVIVIDSPIEHDQEQLVKLIEFGPAIFKAIQTAFQSGDLENAPFEFKGGYNFRIKKDKSGEYASYTTSSFAPKQTDIADDVIEAIQLYDLKQFRAPKVDRAHLEAMLIADQTGASVASQETAEGEEPAPTKAVTTAKPAVVETEKKTSVVDQIKNRAEEKKLSVVEQIKLRAAQRAAAAAGSED